MSIDPQIDLGAGLPPEDEEPISPPGVDVTIRLEESEYEKLGQRLIEEWNRYHAATESRRENLRRWRSAWEMMPAEQAAKRWRTASAIQSAITRIYCNAHAARLNQQILHATPPMSIVAKEPDVIERLGEIEDALTARFEEADWKKAAREVHEELPQAGNVALSVTYDIQTRRVPYVEIETDDDNLGALVESGVEPAEAMFDALKTDSRGVPKRRVQFENKVVYAGLKFKVIPWEDLVIFPATARDTDSAYGIGERVRIRGADLQRGAKSGLYREEAVEKLLAGPEDPQGDDRESRLDNAGVDSTGSAGEGAQDDPLYREYECGDLCWLDDFNHDNELEWAMVTVHIPSGEILRLHYLPWEHGQPHYILFPYLSRVRELFGMGIAELLATLQNADTALWNQLIDANDLALLLHKTFFYDPNSRFKADKVELDLGVPIALEDPTRNVLVPQFTPLPAEAYNLRQHIKDACDLVTSASNPSLGKTTDADKTLGEVQIVAAAANMQFEELAAGVAMTWAKVWDQARWLLAQFGDYDSGVVEYRKAATSGKLVTDEMGQQVPAVQVGGQLQPALGGMYFGAISTKLLRAEIDIVPTGLQQLADMQSRVAQATQVMQTLLQHPLTKQNMEIQRMVLDNYLQAIHFPLREKVMALVEQMLAAEQMVDAATMGGLMEQAQAEEQAQQLEAAGAPPEAMPGNGPAPPRLQVAA